MFQENATKSIENLINQKETILLDFYASWCVPCQKLMPIVDNFFEQDTNIKLVKVDVDVYTDLVLKYNIKSFPTLILFKNGQETKRQIGLCTEQELNSFLK
ncbi:thioredoxin ['Camptotheca acuminata' phytoplasma]|uniref:thioredoxin n=1 Tax='Camptotheca acuminata' phytoplasma TaxID=3239192 RepID=UPI00351A4E00